jgi:hypothetical protein
MQESRSWSRFRALESRPRTCQHQHFRLQWRAEDREWLAFPSVDHDGLELAITFEWNARSQWAGLRMKRMCPTIRFSHSATNEASTAPSARKRSIRPASSRRPNAASLSERTPPCSRGFALRRITLSTALTLRILASPVLGWPNHFETTRHRMPSLRPIGRRATIPKGSFSAVLEQRVIDRRAVTCPWVVRRRAA